MRSRVRVRDLLHQSLQKTRKNMPHVPPPNLPPLFPLTLFPAIHARRLRCEKSIVVITPADGGKTKEVCDSTNLQNKQTRKYEVGPTLRVGIPGSSSRFLFPVPNIVFRFVVTAKNLSFLRTQKCAHKNVVRQSFLLFPSLSFLPRVWKETICLRGIYRSSPIVVKFLRNLVCALF